VRAFISWRTLADEYLEHRKVFGNDLKRQSNILYRFTKHLDDTGFVGPLTTAVQIDWIRNQTGKTSFNRARKLNTVRLFSRYLSLFDPGTEIPDRGIFGRLQSRFDPHIYTEGELKLFFSTMSTVFKDKNSFSATTYEYAFGLMLTCGLRASETANLFCDDVDLEKGIVRIVEGKFKKSRLVPVDSSTLRALTEYKRLRDRAYPRCRTTAFFVVANNHPITYCGMQKTFFQTRKKLGWTGFMKHRIHDLRHTFVVNRLIAWHRSGEDSEQKIAALSVYIGHAKVSDTYWYFHFVPELMEIVSKRFESAWEDARRAS
jgi:integrase